MKIEESKVKKFKISELDRIDPITVFVEDFETGKGEITIKCYGESWTTYWGGMSGMNLIDFYLSCNNDYIANRLWDHRKPQTEPDYNSLTNSIRKIVLGLRREHIIDSELAREVFDESCWEELMPQHQYDEWSAPMFACEKDFKGFAEFYLADLEPSEVATGEYRYLIRIVQTVREAFEMMALKEAA